MRRVVPGPGPDRFLSPELQTIEDLLASGGLLVAVNEEVGQLA